MRANIIFRKLKICNERVLSNKRQITSYFNMMNIFPNKFKKFNEYVININQEIGQQFLTCIVNVSASPARPGGMLPCVNTMEVAVKHPRRVVMTSKRVASHRLANMKSINGTECLSNCFSNLINERKMKEHNIK